MLVSTDKAVSPINLYGSTKLTAENYLFQQIYLKEKEGLNLVLQDMEM